MSTDPRDWSISAAMNGGDSTRMTRADVARCTRYLVRTDMPAAHPIRFRARRPRRWLWLTAQQWACIGLVLLVAGYMLAEVIGWWR